jgi:hypothetical protein
MKTVDKRNYALIIKANAITPIVTATAYLFGLHISVVAQGTTWILAVTDRSTPNAKVLVPAYTLYLEPDVGATVPGRPANPRHFEWLEIPKLMQGGINIVTGPGTAGEVHVWADYITADTPS